MPDERRAPMSDAERETLKILWEHGPLAVRDVLSRLVERGNDWTRSTAITLLQRLEKKGYVASDKDQFAFIFRATVTREDVMRSQMHDLAGQLCDGQALPLVLAFAEQHRFSAEDLARFKAMIAALEGRRGKRGGT